MVVLGVVLALEVEVEVEVEVGVSASFSLGSRTHAMDCLSSSALLLCICVSNACRTQ